MKDWAERTGDAARELEEADNLLRKADALLKRHRAGSEPHADAATSADDIPILTDVVAEFARRGAARDAARRAAGAMTDERPPLPTPPARDSTPPPRDSATTTDLPIDLDAELTRELEAWFANELPQLVTRELDGLAAKLCDQAIAHLRATLLPALSKRIAKRLEDDPRDD